MATIQFVNVKSVVKRGTGIVKLFKGISAKIHLNWAVVNLAHKKEPCGSVQNGVFYRQIGAGTSSYTRQKSGLVIARLLYFRAWQRFIWLITSLMLVRGFLV